MLLQVLQVNIVKKVALFVDQHAEGACPTVAPSTYVIWMAAFENNHLIIRKYNTGPHQKTYVPIKFGVLQNVLSVV